MCGRYVIYSADELIDLHDIVEEAQRRADAIEKEAKGRTGAAQTGDAQTGAARTGAARTAAAQTSIAQIGDAQTGAAQRSMQHQADFATAEAQVGVQLQADFATAEAQVGVQLQADFTGGGIKVQSQAGKLLKVKTGEIFPTNIAPILISPEHRTPSPSLCNTLEAHPMIWGYPQFDGKKGVVINTRLEAAGEKPFWRDSLMQRRCVVPTSGFFEWQHGGPFDKQRYLFDLPDEPILYLAGIYKAFPAAGVMLAERFSILTTAPNNSIRAVHDRMPVVLRSDELAEWLYGDPLAFIDRSGIELRQRDAL